jgi:hypothetical protein
MLRRQSICFDAQPKLATMLPTMARLLPRPAPPLRQRQCLPHRRPLLPRLTLLAHAAAAAATLPLLLHLPLSLRLPLLSVQLLRPGTLVCIQPRQLPLIRLLPLPQRLALLLPRSDATCPAAPPKFLPLPQGLLLRPPRPVISLCKSQPCHPPSLYLLLLLLPLPQRLGRRPVTSLLL